MLVRIYFAGQMLLRRRKKMLRIASKLISNSLFKKSANEQCETRFQLNICRKTMALDRKKQCHKISALAKRLKLVWRTQPKSNDEKKISTFAVRTDSDENLYPPVLMPTSWLTYPTIFLRRGRLRMEFFANILFRLSSLCKIQSLWEAIDSCSIGLNYLDDDCFTQNQPFSTDIPSIVRFVTLSHRHIDIVLDGLRRLFYFR